MPRRRRHPEKWPPLRTPRLLLRPFRRDDLEDIHAYGSDPEVTRFMPWGPNTPEDSRAFLGRMLAEQAVWPRASVGMAAELLAERRVIGALHFAVVDPASRTGEFGYTLGRPWWGRGLAAEATAALIDNGFEALGLHRVFATCDVRNRRSWRVMEKLGMRREATFIKDVRVRGRWRDSHLYAILAPEWRAARTLPSGPSAP